MPTGAEGRLTSPRACWILTGRSSTSLDEAHSRGRNLLEADSDGEYLTEFYGVTGWLLDELDAVANTDRLRKRYDSSLDGAVLLSSRYGHERGEGWGRARVYKHPQQRFAALQGDLERGK